MFRNTLEYLTWISVVRGYNLLELSKHEDYGWKGVVWCFNEQYKDIRHFTDSQVIFAISCLISYDGGIDIGMKLWDIRIEEAIRG